ncbi:3'-5' exonuclease [Rhizobiaceae bacterium n13]|uniref:3'-5' exonuclease n=1 Tax=Ferirhizobium litorale TaxID=2927786 RepID=A0AAE3QKP2_9HYPH|nr:3'-5' exonuclease [Fererhizobium litorale]MDI7864978.1 3'-5' exonuclease [Fererhizobium litorale]MDI7925071.1 3'-5' exonuclease [Fererhizobium litorale]
MTVQYDMFDPASEPVKRGRGTTRLPTEIHEAEMVRLLQATGRYRVLTKLQPRPVVQASNPSFPLCGVIVDTETTGLKSWSDEVIEIGAVAFSFAENGTIGEVTGVYGSLQQPSRPIPPEITRLTGITDAMVAGQAIDRARLDELVAPADLIIAHNAGFDRPFCEQLSPVFADKAWACSVSEVDWSARGFEGTKLGYLVGQAGYFHDGHRAVDDCFALFEVLDRKSDCQDRSPFAELFDASQRSRVRIYAEHSPFELKDQLKGRGYRWSDGTYGRPKAWWTEVSEVDLDDELSWLRSEIYRYEANPPLRRLTAFDRFKN